MLTITAFGGLNETFVQLDHHDDCCGSGRCNKPTYRRYESDATDVENYGSQAEQALWLALRGIRSMDLDRQERLLRG